jgi:hypothetical protein
MVLQELVVLQEHRVHQELRVQVVLQGQAVKMVFLLGKYITLTKVKIAMYLDTKS